jgi:hypothetical protein
MSQMGVFGSFPQYLRLFQKTEESKDAEQEDDDE